MKRLPSALLALSFILAAALPLAAEEAAAPAPVAPPAPPRTRASPHETVNAMINGTRVIVVYGRPYSAKGGKGEKREIWGHLVPFDEVWRTGADEATLLIAEKDIVVGGARVPAGAYTLFTLPAADGSAKLIINKQVGQWGINSQQKANRDEKLDLAVVDLKKDTLSAPVDQFTIALTGSRNGDGAIKLAWENLQYSAVISAAK